MDNLKTKFKEQVKYNTFSKKYSIEHFASSDKDALWKMYKKKYIGKLNGTCSIVLGDDGVRGES